jgi:membrane dipeptidase
MPPAICSRRELARLAAAFAFAGCGGETPSARAAARATPVSPAPRWYDDAIVIDGCGGIGRDDPDRKPGTTYNALDLADATQSGVTAFNVTVDDVTNDEHAYEHTKSTIADTCKDIAINSQYLAIIRSLADLRAAKQAKKVGFILGFQGATALGPDLQHLDGLYLLGVRIMQLTYNIRNLLGDGCLEPSNAGLSNVGRTAVEKMNAAGILIDLSHCGQRTTAEAIELSKKPVAITHTGCAALADRPRNKRDEEMRKCAEKGGIVGIYCMPFLRLSGQPTSDDVVQHIEHALDICGEDHVSVGTDGTISPIAITPAFIAEHRKFVEERRKQGISAPGESVDVYNFCADLNTPRRFETLGDKLLARKHSETRVKKILGGNFARVFGEACG